MVAGRERQGFHWNEVRTGAVYPFMINAISHLGLVEDIEIELDVAALELSSLDHPGVNLKPYLGVLDAIEASLAVCAETHSTADRARVLASVLADDYGFAGDRIHYDDPDNADLISVIDRRLGLPISLSILYVAMARRRDWPAMPLNTPGHVLVRLGDTADPLIIDPFNAGRTVNTAQVAALVTQALGAGATASAMLPMSNRSALVRLLLNQATRAEKSGDAARALILYERMTVTAPMHADGWWERARLQRATRDLFGARKSLSAMFEITRDAALREQISAALDALAREGG